MDRVKIFAQTIEDSATEQIKELSTCEAYGTCSIRIMPDCHTGTGCTIGTVIQIKDCIIPNTVGVDIGCGMYVVPIDEKQLDLAKLDIIINNYVPAGFNIHNSEIRHYSGIDGTLYCRKYVGEDKAQRSIGTLGGGNHFIEVDISTNGRYYLVIHSGSRNLGVRICDYYQNLAEESCKIDKEERNSLIEYLKSQNRQTEISEALKKLQPKVKNMQLAYLVGPKAKDYIHDMTIAQEYAKFNRETIADTIFNKMQWKHGIGAFHTIHNYIDAETKILRKGAVSAFKGEKLIIPMNMRDGSLLCVGKGNEDWLYSAPHGAGRLMSRKQAFDTLKMEDFKKQMSNVYSTSVCPETLDESPMAYKPMQEIVDSIKDTVEILDVIKPVYNFKASN